MWEPALHNQTGSTTCPAINSFGKNAVNFTRVWLGPTHRSFGISEERLIQTVGTWPNLAGNKAVGSTQQLQVIVIKDVRLTLKVELGQSE
jgi:hypothetical protein